MSLCIVDVETTGTDPARHHVWEVGLIVRDAGRADAEYCWQIRPDLATADPAALRVGRYRARCQVQAGPVGAVRATSGPADPGGAGELAAFLAGVLDGAALAGINVQFDRDFIAAFLRSNGEILTADYHLIDVCPLAAGWLHGHGRAVVYPWRSDDLARSVGIDPGAYERHSALADARFARDIYDVVTAAAVPAAA